MNKFFMVNLKATIYKDVVIYAQDADEAAELAVDRFDIGDVMPDEVGDPDVVEVYEGAR